MRTQAICLALAIVLICPVASVQWVQQNSGANKNLYGVSFTDAKTGTVVGDSGTILRTSDGGATWFTQASGTGDVLNAVSFADGSTGMAVGGNPGGSLLLRTTNGGATWETLIAGRGGGYNCIRLTDATTATVVGRGGVILRTTDKGTTWIRQWSSGSTNLHAVCFTDANTGTAVGDSGIILRTTDGGGTWSSQRIGWTACLMGVSFCNTNTGAAVGYGKDSVGGEIGLFGYTTNGGVSWSWLILGNGMTHSAPLLNAVCFSDANTVRAVGFEKRVPRYGTPAGCIFHTTNSGANWGVLTFTTRDSLYGVSFTDANTGTVVGSGGTILHTTNGGETFIRGEQTTQVPTDFSLRQNYPNPFNPATTIRYSLPHKSQVFLALYNALGQQVASLVHAQQEAGEYEVKFDGSALASGVFFYRLQTGSFVDTKRLLLLK